jgi:hypothetical protein
MQKHFLFSFFGRLTTLFQLHLLGATSRFGSRCNSVVACRPSSVTGGGTVLLFTTKSRPSRYYFTVEVQNVWTFTSAPFPCPPVARDNTLRITTLSFRAVSMLLGSRTPAQLVPLLLWIFWRGGEIDCRCYSRTARLGCGGKTAGAMEHTYVLIIFSYYLFTGFSWHFSSWTNGEPHHSGFKFLIVALSL